MIDKREIGRTVLIYVTCFEFRIQPKFECVRVHATPTQQTQSEKKSWNLWIINFRINVF